MTVQQISIFLENKPEALSRLTQTLAQSDISLRAISLADTSDFGIARIIVDDVEATKKVLEANDFLVKVNPVIAVEIPDAPGSLNHILTILADNKRNLEYMYGFTGRKANQAYMIIRTTDIPKTEEVLAKAFIRMVDQSEIRNI
ncbi:MAG: ACT domain-containing protein [Sphaerochaetaceae bacterium]|nr:ACT domain-containing protein [Sphaerochaetaceae bacterium]